MAFGSWRLGRAEAGVVSRKGGTTEACSEENAGLQSGLLPQLDNDDSRQVRPDLEDEPSLPHEMEGCEAASTMSAASLSRDRRFTRAI